MRSTHKLEFTSAPDLAPVETAPRTVAVEILHGCNFGCTFCYLPEFRPGIQTRSVPELRVTFDILAELARAGVAEVYLLGGEPMLHPNFDKICERITQLDFPKRGLVTNGSLLSRQRIQNLKRLGFWVDVSVRAVDPTMQAKIVRRTGTLTKVMEGLRLLTAESIPLGIEIDCLPANRDHIFEIIECILIEGIKIRNVLLHRIAAQGAAGKNLGATTLSLADYQVILGQAKAIYDRFGVQIAFEDGLPLCLVAREKWNHIKPCECGHTLATVDPSGNVRRCACHPETIGNLLEVPIEQIWTDRLRQFRSGDWQSAACHTCSVFEQCRGGCAVSNAGSRGYSEDLFASMIRPILGAEPLPYVENSASAKPEHSSIIALG